MRVIGHIKSVMLSQESQFGAPGRYELDIELDEFQLSFQKDKPGYITRCIATHLAGCCRSTGIPPNEGVWIVTLNEWIRKRYPSLPEEFRA